MGRTTFWAIALVASAAGACSGAIERPAAPGPAATVSGPGSPPTAPTAREVTITIVGTNDAHGTLARLPVLAAHVRVLREARSRDGGAVLLLDAGDVLQGTLESNLTEGASMVRAYGALAYDAVALGNHEFDFGPVGHAARARNATDDPQGALRARLAEASFPWLSANLLDTRTGTLPAWTNLAPSVLVEAAGVRVGVIGGLTEDTPHVVMAGNLDGLRITALGEALATGSEQLRRRGAEIVVAVLHAGGDCTRFDDPHDATSCKPNQEITRVLAAVPRGAVDAVVGGHTHRAMAHYVNGVPVVEAYARSRAFSRIDLRFDREARRVTGTTLHPPRDLCAEGDPEGPCSAGTYEGAAIRPDDRLAQIIAPDVERARAVRAEPVGVTLHAPVTAAFDGESALGNLFADALLAAAPSADLAIVNGGSLRRDLPPGPLRYGALFEAMPFDNQVATVRLRGSELRAVFTAHLASDAHGFASVSGARVLATCDDGALRVRIMRDRRGRKDPTDIRDADLVEIVTSDYLAAGGDGFFAPASPTPTAVDLDRGVGVRGVLRRDLARRRSVDPGTRGGPARPRGAIPSTRPVTCRASTPRVP